MLVFMRERTAGVAFAAISLLLCFAAFALAARGEVQHQSFKAFYCGATAVRDRHDPYLVEPLRTCERSLEQDPMPQGYVEPAPLPGYSLAAFVPLTLLPPKLAAELFARASGACFDPRRSMLGGIAARDATGQFFWLSRR